MKRIAKSVAIWALAVGLAACGDDGPENGAAPANAAAAEDNSAMENAMMADPSNPYAHAEMQMHERMMAAVGTDVSDTWVKKMIEHHRGAVEMSNIVLQQGAEGRVREMAQMTVTNQTREIGELEAMAKQGVSSSEAAAAFRPAETEMHDRMMAARGADASETWISKMIEHHRGAVAMSEIAIARGQDAAVREKARKTAGDQRKEMAELERMLLGEAAPAAAAAGSPPAAKAEPKGAPKKAATPKAKPKPKETPPTDPHAGHDMNKM